MTDEYYMMLALKEARRAFDEDEVPGGAIVVLNEKTIAAFLFSGNQFLIIMFNTCDLGLIYKNLENYLM